MNEYTRAMREAAVGYAGQVHIHVDGALRRICDCGETVILQVQNKLERTYGDPQAMKLVAEEEAGIRKLLRAIRFWLGANENMSHVVEWPVAWTIAEEVHFKDVPGKSHTFDAKVNDILEWKACAEAEVELFRENLLDVTWGKIHLRPEWFGPVSLDALSTTGRFGMRTLKSVASNHSEDISSSVAVFVFAPKCGTGTRPGGHKVAQCFPPKAQLLSRPWLWLPASEERMTTRGRFAGLDKFRDRAGLAHEFWHAIVHLVEQLQDSVMIPNLDRDSKFPVVRDELKELGVLLEPETKLFEYYAMWPTWDQARLIAESRTEE